MSEISTHHTTVTLAFSSPLFSRPDPNPVYSIPRSLPSSPCSANIPSSRFVGAQSLNYKCPPAHRPCPAASYRLWYYLPASLPPLL